MSLNKVIIMGNLTRDPEVRFTQGGTAVGDIGLAINRRVKQGDQWTEEVTFVDVTLWGTTAENAQKYLTKGRGVLVEGRLQLDTWEDKQSGQKRSKLKVVCENLTFLPGKNDNEPAPRQRQQTAQRQGPPRQENGAVPAGHTWEDDDSDEIPF